MTNRASTRFRVIFMILSGLSIAFAFVHSMMPASVSSAESNSFVMILRSFFQIFGVAPEAVPGLVRKLAHYTEFSVIGAMLTSSAYSFDRIKPYRYLVQVLFVGLLTAVTDETIQLFVEGRAGMIVDVWIDFSGVLTGTAVMLLFYTIYKNARNLKAIPHNSGVRIAQQDFSSGCTNKSR